MTRAERWIVIFLMTIGLVVGGRIMFNTEPVHGPCPQEITPNGMVTLPC
jgi:hypothetical protein